MAPSKNIGIDEELLKKTFEKEWIDKLDVVVREYIKTGKGINNIGYFNRLGDYIGRNDSCLTPELSDYFNRLLFAPNIPVLDFVIKNHEDMKNLKFVDNGAGLGILSVFLKKLDIECYNFDPGPQIVADQITIHENILSAMNLTVHSVTKEVPKDGNVLINCGIGVYHEELLNLNWKYCMMDEHYSTKGIIKNILNKNDIKKIAVYPDGNIGDIIIVASTDSYSHNFRKKNF